MNQLLNNPNLLNNLSDFDITFEKEIIPVLMNQLFPICRSITGSGVRKSLNILKQITDFEIHEIASGTKCFDWEVPNEWNIKDAFIEDSEGKKIVDFQENNLHVVNYSIPIDSIMTFNELKHHLHMLPDMPTAIPYRTSYYKREWGFCLKHEQFKKMNTNSNFHVVVNSSLTKGSMSIGEYFIQGEYKSEFIFSTYCCHPSMANDNLSGMILWILLLKFLKSKKTKFSYRFTIMPETIGTIAYLSKNENHLSNLRAGFVLSCVGGPGSFSYKSSFLENHLIDQIVVNTLEQLKIDFVQFPFVPRGSDERQFSSPGFRIPIGLLCKDKFHEYDNYHTSLDDLDFISESSILSTFLIYVRIIDALEQIDESMIISNNVSNNVSQKSKYPFFRSLNPKCEPMLSKKNLYPSIGGSLKHIVSKNEKSVTTEKNLELLLNILFYSDGKTSIESIASKSSMSENEILIESENLTQLNLLEKI